MSNEETTFDYNAAVNNAIEYVLERLPEIITEGWVSLYAQTGTMLKSDYIGLLTNDEAALFEQLCEESGEPNGGHSGASFGFTQSGTIAKVIGL